MAQPARHNPNRTYGRRKGHALSPRRQRLVDELLPRLRVDISSPPPDPFSNLFPVDVSEVCLEVGFGAGEHLLWQAEHNPQTGYIGCEPYINGVAALLAGIDERGLRNIRLFDADARELLDWLPDASISRVFVLFPDPWPKTRHHKRRFISQETLRHLSRVMASGAELRIASDIGDYVRSCLEVIMAGPDFEWLAERPADWRKRPDDWPQTRYEAKALRQGRKGHFLRVRKI